MKKKCYNKNTKDITVDGLPDIYSVKKNRELL